MPTVLFDNYIENNPNVAYVGTDSYEGIDMAVKHLHNLGHKKIAFINGSLFSLVSDQRQEAFENSMRDAGLEIYPELMGHGYYIPGDCTVLRFQFLLQRALLLSSVAAMLSQRVLYLNASCTASMCQMI